MHKCIVLRLVVLHLTLCCSMQLKIKRIRSHRLVTRGAKNMVVHVPLVYFGSLIQQEFHYLDVPFTGGVMQRRP